MTPIKVNPNQNMHIGSKGTTMIKGFESCKLVAYKDYKDSFGEWVYSIGWGHSHVPAGLVINQEQADTYFTTDAMEREHILKNLITIPLNQDQFDGTMSILYNVSMVEFRELAAIINKGDIEASAKGFLQYNMSGGKVLRGLTNRRNMEAKLFKGEL